MIRLNKLMGNQGLCSRREADRLIEAGFVLVNGKTIDRQPGIKVSADSTVSLLPEAFAEKKITLVLNKPLGYVSTQPEKGYLPAVRLLTWSNLHSKQQKFPGPAPRDRQKLGVCGRLDIHSTGLLLFTQDGRVAQRFMQPHKYSIEKEYLVRFSCDLTAETRAIDQLRSPIWDQGEELRAVSVDVLNPNQLRIMLHEGKNHHIRRMCRAVGLDLIALKRVRIGSIELGNLPVGQWKYLKNL